MSLEFGAIAGLALKTGLPIVAKATIERVNKKLNPGELQQALEAGIVQAQKWDQRQKLDGKSLFHYCDDRETDKFLAKVFESSKVQSELDKPLKDEGVLDLPYFVGACKEVAAALNIRLNEPSLETWIQEFWQVYFDKTGSLRFQVARERYLSQLVNLCDDVKFAGIAVEGQDIERSRQLQEIFVIPDVKEEKPDRLEIQLEAPPELVDDPQQRVMWEQQQQLRQLQASSSGKTLSAKDFLKQSRTRKAVLLGLPGSGKTTLMNCFAVAATSTHDAALPISLSDLGLPPDTLPILIRIRDLARSPDKSILSFITEYVKTELQVDRIPEAFFEHWLSQGKALILLDGLDEVADETHRFKIVQRIEHFLDHYKQNWAIVTSRPAGYRRDFFREEEFPHYVLQPFDDPKIHQFIHCWYETRFFSKAEAERRRETLKKALARNERIKQLAGNPLLLTVIALIHRYQAELPRERHKLYDSAVDTLLRTWDANKELSNREILKHIESPEVLRRLMERLAY